MNELPFASTTATDPWPDRRKKMREREWRIYEKLLDQCERAIDSLFAEPRLRLTALDITRLLDLAERIGRLAAGLPSDHTAHTIDDERTPRLHVADAIKKIYSQPLESLIARMHQPPTININSSNEPSS